MGLKLFAQDLAPEPRRALHVDNASSEGILEPNPPGSRSRGTGGHQGAGLGFFTLSQTQAPSEVKKTWFLSGKQPHLPELLIGMKVRKKGLTKRWSFRVRPYYSTTTNISVFLYHGMLLGT